MKAIEVKRASNAAEAVSEAVPAAPVNLAEPPEFGATTHPPNSGVLSVNGVVIGLDAIEAERTQHADAADPDHAARRALLVRELLTQKAIADGVMAEGGDLSDEIINRLVEKDCAAPSPSDEECRRYYAANGSKFRSPDLVLARHILFALTGNGAMTQVRARAEEVHGEIAAHPERFEALALALSNCPSGQVGGNLGQLTQGESVPEFDAAVFDGQRLGLLPGLVKTRYGFHVVSVERRIPGAALPYEAVREAIARYLSEYVRHKSIQQYLTLLASGAELRGIALDLKSGPLLQ